MSEPRELDSSHLAVLDTLHERGAYGSRLELATDASRRISASMRTAFAAITDCEAYSLVDCTYRGGRFRFTLTGAGRDAVEHRVDRRGITQRQTTRAPRRPSAYPNAGPKR